MLARLAQRVREPARPTTIVPMNPPAEPPADPPSSSTVRIRPVRPEDDPGLERIIREVMTEFGAVGDGFAIEDDEVRAMYAAYRAPRHAFLVVQRGREILGGGGVAPLAGGDADVCELRKMYFLPQLRGLGVGSRLLSRLMDTARELGFARCYLETLESMDAARVLYTRHGFRPIERPLGATGHCGCDSWYLRDL